MLDLVWELQLVSFTTSLASSRQAIKLPRVGLL